MRLPTLVKTALATGAAAVVGSVATRPASAWYRSSDKPRWQPPPAVFPMVWTPLYTLNAGWTALFFRVRNPKLALAEIAVLNAANLALLRRAWQADRRAGAMLLPYVAWTGFATALNASIATRNAGANTRA